MPNLVEEIERLYRETRDARQRQRLLCAKLAAQGEYTAQQIADICGVSRGGIFLWLKKIREEGIDAFLNYDKPGPKPGERCKLPQKVALEIEQGLQNGAWPSVSAICRWLKEKYNLDFCYHTVWKWVKKAGGVLRVPRRETPRTRRASGSEIQGRTDREIERNRLTIRH